MDVESAWQEMDRNESSHQVTNIFDASESKIEEMFSRNCVLYFPPNRFEEPAWLNEDQSESQGRVYGLETFKRIHDPQDYQLFTSP